jgi:3-hydroxyacyl-CoA dehydrogenase
LVIEAAIENLDPKKKIFTELDGICPRHAILASNTSGLPVIEMAMATRRPDKVLGLHFFNPAPVYRAGGVGFTLALTGSRPDGLGCGRDFPTER